MTNIYPPIKPYQTHRLERDGHSLYIEEAGNPDGMPVIFLHGGPGGGISPLHRSFYDPNLYRIILFDQRGCGQSTPHAELSHNTTDDLIADIEAIRALLKIQRWVVAGGSWGTTLALVYAIRYTPHVMGLLLRGVFLAREQDMHWLYSPTDGASQVFPDFYQDFIRPLAKAPKTAQDVISGFYALLTSDNELLRLQAAKTWCIWEGRISRLRHQAGSEKHYAEPHSALSMARLECHYFYHQCFFADNYILDNLDPIQSIPGIIVHGRYDMICKLENATTLQRNWPAAELQIVQEAGHSTAEKPIAKALCGASDKLYRLLRRK